MANHKPGFPQENLVYGLEKTTSEKQLLPTDKTLRYKATQGGRKK